MASASQYVPAVRSELEKLARTGRITYYKDLGATIGKPARWTLWKDVLDDQLHEARHQHHRVASKLRVAGSD